VNRTLFVGAIATLLTGTAVAQEVRVQTSEPPHFVGEPVDVQLIVEGFAREPEPDLHVGSPNAAGLELVGMSPNVRSSISIVEGRVTRRESVQFVYRYRFVAKQPGRHTIGPFRVEQAALSASAPELALEVAAVPPSDQIRLRLVLPETPIYPGQRVPLAIEWSFAAELRERLHRYRIRSPLFDRSDAFRFLDPPTKPSDTELSLETASGQLSLPAEVTTRKIGGKDFLVVAAKWTLVPLTTGTFEFGAASVVVDVVTSWRRDLLGGRVPQRVRKRRAADLPRTLVVREIPSEGRPAGFAGAVGQGFTLEVNADRSVVQVGDPIQLTVVLRGDGNLENAGLPESAAEMGLSQQQFRLPPPGDVDGVVENGAKTFSVSVRALSESVQEIPPLAYAYFDPAAGDYKTTRSRPIALSVRPASLVTAQDVVSGEPDEGWQDLRSTEAGTPILEQGDGSASAFSPTGANLSIVREPERLLGATRAAIGSRALIALYVGSLSLVALAIGLRRRADVDPELVARRKALRRERGRIAAATKLPRSRAVETIAEALRAMVRLSTSARPEQLDEFVAECDAVIFAPERGEAEPLDPVFRQRALELADALLDGAS
jgi:hypothetical protein